MIEDILVIEPYGGMIYEKSIYKIKRYLSYWIPCHRCTHALKINKCKRYLLQHKKTK